MQEKPLGRLGARRVVGRLRLGSEHADPRREPLCSHAHAGNEPTSADRRHHGVERGDLVEELLGAGGLACNHIGVVVGRDERAPGLPDQGPGRGLPRLLGRLALDDSRAVLLDGAPFHR